MYSIDNETVVSSVSELRSQIREVLKEVKSFKKVLITCNNKPAAMILNIEHYKSLVNKLEELEDSYFGEIAQKRLLDHEPEKSADIDDLL
jgi:prevent-host-death family protein|tara:strand:+ start:368 stop:637 length:270 start_codon:yes stop_codon:yes gene_type:complete